MSQPGVKKMLRGKVKGEDLAGHVFAPVSYSEFSHLPMVDLNCFLAYNFSNYIFLATQAHWGYICVVFGPFGADVNWQMRPTFLPRWMASPFCLCAALLMAKFSTWLFFHLDYIFLFIWIIICRGVSFQCAHDHICPRIVSNLKKTPCNFPVSYTNMKINKVKINSGFIYPKPTFYCYLSGIQVTRWEYLIFFYPFFAD